MSCENAGVKVELENHDEILPSVQWGTETRIATTGVLSLTKFSETHYPFTWNGTDWASKIQSLNPSKANEYDKITIYWQGKQGGWEPVHRGFCRGSGGTDTEGVGKLYVGSVANFLPAIPASKAFDSPNVSTVLNYLADELSANTPFEYEVGSFDRHVMEINRDSRNTFEGDNVLEQAGDFAGDIGRVIGGTLSNQLSGDLGPSALLDTVKSTKRFKENAHTLKDVASWIQSEAEGRLWIAPTKPLTLVFDRNGSKTRQFTTLGEKSLTRKANLAKMGSYSAPSNNFVDVINNDALSEVNPINAQVVNGKTNWSIDGYPVAFLSSKKFPHSKAVHTDLKELAGGNELSGQVRSTDSKTLEGTSSKARHLLMERIVSGGEGDVLAYCRPDIAPYDSIRMKPSCEEISRTELPSTNYLVRGVRHRKSARPEDREEFAGVSYITVSVKVDPSDIEIVESKMKHL